MDKKKIGIFVAISLAILAVGILIGFFIGKGSSTDVSGEITTTLGETTEATTTDEETTEEETTAESTTKAPQYTEANEVVYATTNVNIRKGAGTSSTVVGGLKKGDSIQRTAIGDNGWSKVSYNGKTAYVYSKYLTTVSPDVNEVDMCGISNTDMNNLKEMLEYILFYGMPEGAYNSTSKDAFEKAFKIIHGVPFWQFSDVVGDVYRIHHEQFVYFPDGEDDTDRDPRGYWAQYRYVEGAFIDMILEEIFNVKPNHNYVLYSEEWEGKKEVEAYYEDGFYYSAAWDGGDGCGPDLTVKDVKVLSDGKYQITMNYRIIAGDEIVENCGDYIIVAKMKLYEGNSLWSFYEIKEA